jgi:RNA polymerase sigma factor (sigma-70 family)
MVLTVKIVASSREFRILGARSSRLRARRGHRAHVAEIQRALKARTGLQKGVAGDSRKTMTILARRKAAQPRGDETSSGIEALFEDHAPMVLAICRYHLRDHQAAEDAAQETFLSAHRSLLGGTRPRDPAAWLATIARNQCRRGLRTRTPHAAPFDDARAGTVADPADIVADRAALTEVTSAIAHLPPRQREALVMRELWGLSYEQVAAAMHLSASAVDSLLSRARRTLSEQFGDIPKAARGVLVVPASLREQLSRFIPELDPAVATAAGVASGGGAGAAAFASLGSAPAAAKIAATGAAAIAIAVPVQATMRGDAGHKVSHRPSATQIVRPAIVRSSSRPVIREAPAISTPRPAVPRTEERSSSGPGSGSSGSSSGTGSESSGSDSSGSGSGSGSSGSGSGESGSGSGSGSSGSGSGSSGSGSGESSSGSGSGSSGSGSGSSGSGSSGSGSSGSGSESSGSGSGSSGSEESGSGDSSSGSSGSGRSGSG